MGLPHAVIVTTADVTGRDGALQMIGQNLDNLSCVKKFLVDGGYSGERFAGAVKELCGAEVEVVKRNERINLSSCLVVGLSSVCLAGSTNFADFGKIVSESFILLCKSLFLLFLLSFLLDFRQALRKSELYA